MIKFTKSNIYGRVLRSSQRSLGLRPKDCRPQAAGFTLMELLVVIAVIGVLMGISFPAIQAAINRAKISRARAEILTLQQAWQAYWNTYYEPGDPPRLPKYWPTETVEMDDTAVAVLAGEDEYANPLGIAFMEFDKRHLDDGFLNPWKKFYKVELGQAPTNVPGWTYRTRFYIGNGARGKY